MMLLLVELQARPGAGEQVAELLVGLARQATDEPGTLFYAVHRQEENADALVLYELYRDRAAWEAHMALPAVQVVLQQFDALLAQPPRLVFCDPLAWSGIKPLPLLPE